MVEPWRNQLSPRQVATELHKFVTSADLAQSSTNIQVRYHGAAIAEVAEVLTRLKEQLLLHESRSSGNFPIDFISPVNNGLDLLLRTLAVIQRQLHEAEQHNNNQSRFSTLLHRNSSNKRRKSGIAEADCLECIKLLLQKTQSWRLILDHTTNIEILLISVTSPQLDSKCYALELVGLLLEQPGGFPMIMRAFTSLAGKNRDDSRLQIIVSQLKHGLSTSKLHIQILVVRLLNKLISQASNLNYRVLVQIEAENAGFSAESLERMASQHGRQADVDILQREILMWKNSYLPLVWLQRKAHEATSNGGYPVMSPVPNGDVSHKLQDNDFDEEGSWRSRRMYSRNNAVSGGVSKNLRKKRQTPQESERGKAVIPVSFPYQNSEGMVHPSQTSGFFPTENVSYLTQSYENGAAPSSIPRPRSRNTNIYPNDQEDTVGRTTNNPAYVHVPFRDELARSKSMDRNSAPFSGPMKRARSENTLYFGGTYPEDPAFRLQRNASRSFGDSFRSREAPPRRNRDRSSNKLAENGALPLRAHTLERDTGGKIQKSNRPQRRDSERVYNPVAKSASREKFRSPSHARSQSLHELHRIGEEEEREQHPSRYDRYRSSTPTHSSSGFPLSSTPINVESEVPEPPPLPDMPELESSDELSGERIVHEYRPEPSARQYRPESSVNEYRPESSVHEYRPEPSRQTTISIDTAAPIPSVRRSRSDAADRVKIQGFSYLFPQTGENGLSDRALTPTPRRAPSPIDDKISVLRAAHRAASPEFRSPSVLQTVERPPSVMTQNEAPQRRSHTPSSYTTSSHHSASVNVGGEERDSEGNVIYIPVRLEGTSQVLSRPHKSIMKTPSTSTTPAPNGVPYNYSYSTESTGPNGTRTYATYTTNRERRDGGGILRTDRDSPRKGSNYGDDVEDALRKFDYLNEYDSSSRGSRYGAY